MTYNIEKWFRRLNYKYTEEELQKTLQFFSESRSEVRRQYENLSWYAEEHAQEQAVSYLAENLLPCEYIFLVFGGKHSLAPYDPQEKYYEGGLQKAYWDNTARTVVKIGWPKVDKIIVPLFQWTIDPNWPGSEMIREFLISLPKEVFDEKVKEILDNPQCYKEYDYKDIKDQIEDMRKDRDEEIF